MTMHDRHVAASVTRFASRGAHRLSYEASGELTGTPVLGLHDLLANKSQLQTMAAEFGAAGSRVLLPDARGHGA
jgi:pimeloyl-ACP methyl ester carboxylesterase